MRWNWPLPELVSVPPREHAGGFGSVRKHDVHTGVDLYCADGTPVRAVEPGVVVWSGPFTGAQADSPWWLDTFAVCVSSDWWTVLYGELAAAGLPAVGTVVAQGDLLGNVTRVLKHDKGAPTAMLHFELYDRTVVKPLWWRKDEKKPLGLLDPTDLLNDTLLKAR